MYLVDIVKFWVMTCALTCTSAGTTDPPAVARVLMCGHAVDKVQHKWDAKCFCCCCCFILLLMCIRKVMWESSVWGVLWSSGSKWGWAMDVVKCSGVGLVSGHTVRYIYSCGFKLNFCSLRLFGIKSLKALKNVIGKKKKKGIELFDFSCSNLDCGNSFEIHWLWFNSSLLMG